MILIICADERGGLLFNNRRLSRDSALCDHILSDCQNKILWMNGYSASIFPSNAPNIRISENFLEEAGKGEFCFAENTDIHKALACAEAVVIYRFHRSYPSDTKLKEELLSGRKLISKVDFAGNSHSIISQEVYQ